MYRSFNFGTALKETRIEQSLSQKDLATGICSQAMLSRIENDEVVPSVILMKKLCNRLDVSLDYILSTDFQLTNFKRNEWVELMKYYHQSTQYKQLQRAINELNLFKKMETKQEQQEFYFYQSCCEYHFSLNAPGALELLDQALYLTYSPEKEIATDMELVILSEISRIHIEQGNLQKAQSYSDKSLSLFYHPSKQRSENQLAKLFYNCSLLQVELRNYTSAIKLIDQGIAWSNRQKNYYFLAELFLLKGMILQEDALIDNGINFVQLAEILKKMVTMDHGMDAQLANIFPSDKHLAKLTDTCE